MVWEHVCTSVGEGSGVRTLWETLSGDMNMDRIHTVFITLPKIDSLFTLVTHQHPHTQDYVFILSASPPAERHLGSVTFGGETSLTAALPVWICPPFMKRTAGWTSVVTSENLACLSLQMSPIYLCTFLPLARWKAWRNDSLLSDCRMLVYLATEDYIYFRVNIRKSIWENRWRRLRGTTYQL